jgi:phosphocarrier protein
LADESFPGKCSGEEFALLQNTLCCDIVRKMFSNMEKESMFEKKVCIRNKAGIHCRPSSMIIAEVEKFPGHEFTLATENGSSTLSSILDLLSLGIQYGEEVLLTVKGPEEEKAGKIVADLLEYEFDFR